MSLLRTSTLRLTGGRSFSTAPTRLFASASTLPSSSSSLAGPWADRPATRLNRYLVVAEDHPNANSRRLEVRERHLEHAQAGKRVGRIELGGAILRKDFDEIDADIGPGPHMAGSVLVVLAESIEDARQRVMQDEYVQGNVWDLERVKIYPFLQAPLVTADEVMGEERERVEAGANATLGQLRQDLAAGKGPKLVTLGALRRMHQSVFRSE